MGSKLLLRICCAGLAVAVMLAGCRRPSVENGRLIFSKNCARCHAQQAGEASRAPNLAEYFSRSPRPGLQQTRELIRDGRRAMPPFGQRLTRREIDDVIAYIEALR